MYTLAVSLLALATVASARVAPVPADAAPATLKDGPGAATPAAAAAPTAPPEFLTISVVNSHTAAITTSHAENANVPPPNGGSIAPGTMTAGETASFAVPTGWAGNVAVNDVGFDITGDVSLLQGAFAVDPNQGFAIADIAVSYVDGFSVAIVCSCDGAVVSGCNLDLYGYGSCPDEDRDGQNGCINPNRDNGTATEATPFFAPCQGAAYTFPGDSGANSNGACQSGQVVCCIGNTCETNPKQPVTPTSSA